MPTTQTQAHIKFVPNPNTPNKIYYAFFVGPNDKAIHDRIKQWVLCIKKTNPRIHLNPPFMFNVTFL